VTSYLSSITQPVALNSAIYHGSVRHRRYVPKYHGFTYQVFMVYLDLHELDQVFSQSTWWSQRFFSLAWFRRKDFFDGQTDTPLYEAVANKVWQETGHRPDGPIRMLTNLRYFGFIINPITCYYCFDCTGKNLETVVAEVTNTPWKQRCHYVLQVDPNSSRQKMQFDKNMHVSPFQPMNLHYVWQGKSPTDSLVVHLDVYDDQDTASDDSVFDATLQLKRQEMTEKNMNHMIWRYPFMTAKVFLAIYWQAMKLFIKGTPFYGKPRVSDL